LEYGVQTSDFKRAFGAGGRSIVAGDWTSLAFVLAGALAGGFVNGLTGFGTGLTALPLWLQALEPVIAAQLVSAASVAGHVATLHAIWHAIDWRRLAPMLGAGLAGVPVGTWLLPLIPIPAFKAAVGALLVLYCAFMLLAAGRVRLQAGGKGAEAAVGLVGGVLGGIAGLSGALPTVWAALKGWPKDERRVFFQVFNLTVLSAMLVASLLQGLVGAGFLLALAVSLPATFAGAWLGSRLYRRLDDRRFDRLVLMFLLLSGLLLVWSST
jgi:uncharacterized membrane protein YfcA